MKHLKKTLIFIVILVVTLLVAKECMHDLIQRMKTPSECEKQALKRAENECVKWQQDADVYSACMSERFKRGREACE
jgi:uncharacterized protein YpmB